MDGTVTLSPGVELFYRLDDFTDPWKKTEAVLFLHGFAENGDAWFQWVPHFARRHRSIRLDQRGFGRSTPMPENFSWSIDVWADDLVRVIGELSPSGVHLVASKIAGPVAIKLTAARPDLVKSLSMVGAVVVGPNHDATAEEARRHGLRHWVDSTMKGRLGEEMDAGAAKWWTELMYTMPLSTALGFLKFTRKLDVTEMLPKLARPVLVIATDSARRPISDIEAWQKQIPHSKIIKAPGAGYHIAASDPDFCAEATAKFIAGLDA